MKAPAKVQLCERCNTEPTTDGDLICWGCWHDITGWTREE